MKDFVLRAYWALERVIAPGLRYSQVSYEEILRRFITSRTVWLDLGCGHQILPEWRLDAERELVNLASYVAGVDIDSVSSAKHRMIKNIWKCDISSLPFPDDSFNLITANMVIEHLGNPSRVFAEIWRVLSPGGSFLFHTPNAHGYITMLGKYFPYGIKKLAAKVLEGRSSEDVYPTYYRCNTENDILKTASESGFVVKQISHIPTGATFARILPMAAVELLWIRATMREPLARYRADILALLSKSSEMTS